MEVLQQTAVNLNIKRLLLIKESQISQVKEFSNFLCTRICKSLGLLKSLLSHSPPQCGASTLCVHILNSLGLIVGHGCSLMATEDRDFSPS